MSCFRGSIALKVALLGLSDPLFIGGNAHADGCSEAEIRRFIINDEVTPNDCDTGALPILIELLKDDRPYVRSNAARGLVSVGRNGVDTAARTEIVVPALVEALKDDDEHVRVGVVADLGNLGADSKLAIPALVEVFKRDTNDDVRLGAINALVDISSFLQATQENLSNTELEQSTKDLDEALKAIEQDSVFANGEELPPLSTPLIELKKELKSRKFGDFIAMFSRQWSWFIQHFDWR